MSCLQNEVAILENKLSDAHQQNARLSKEIAIKDRLREHLEAEIEAAQGENDKLLARGQLLKAEVRRAQTENIRLKKLVCHELFICFCR